MEEEKKSFLNFSEISSEEADAERLKKAAEAYEDRYEESGRLDELLSQVMPKKSGGITFSEVSADEADRSTGISFSEISVDEADSGSGITFSEITPAAALAVEAPTPAVDMDELVAKLRQEIRAEIMEEMGAAEPTYEEPAPEEPAEDEDFEPSFDFMALLDEQVESMAQMSLAEKMDELDARILEISIEELAAYTKEQKSA